MSEEIVTMRGITKTLRIVKSVLYALIVAVLFGLGGGVIIGVMWLMPMMLLAVSVYFFLASRGFYGSVPIGAVDRDLVFGTLFLVAIPVYLVFLRRFNRWVKEHPGKGETLGSRWGVSVRRWFWR
jgi:uncharacterized membrane protein YeiH